MTGMDQESEEPVKMATSDEGGREG